MTRLLGLGVIVLLLGCMPAAAQSTADTYFHEGARAYVAGDRVAARRAVMQGLEGAPDDPRLIALRNKLREGRRPDGSQDSSSTTSGRQSGQEGNESSDETSGGGEEPSKSETDGPPQPGAQDRTAGEGAQSGRQSGQEGDGEAGASGSRRGEQSGGARGGRLGDPSRADRELRGRGGRPVDTLSRAQAERLLRALEGQERRLLQQLRLRSTERRRVEKDW